MCVRGRGEEKMCVVVTEGVGVVSREVMTEIGTLERTCECVSRQGREHSNYPDLVRSVLVRSVLSL